MHGLFENLGGMVENLKMKLFYMLNELITFSVGLQK